MADIVIVVDAQNGFCHPDGIIIERDSVTEDKKRKQGETVARIALFLEVARKRRAPILYLCTNKNLLGSDDLHWHVQIHKDIAPQKDEETFWRGNPNDDPFTADPELLRNVSRQTHTRLLLCGFYANKCVASVAMRAVERAIPVSIIVDCVYPALTGRMKIWYTALARKWPKPINTRMISFETSVAYLADSYQEGSLCIS